MVKLYQREIILALTVALSISIFAEEKRDRVVIMDTGIVPNEFNAQFLCKDGHMDFTGLGIEDANGHGTNIAGLIARGLDTTKQCITVVKYYHDTENMYNGQDPDTVLKASWAYLLTLQSKWVNMSFTGQDYMIDEYRTIKRLLDRGTKVMIAAGNEAKNLNTDCDVYPACYPFKSKNFYVVGAYDLSLSNFNGPVNLLQPGLNQRGHFGPLMSGSSQATANATAKIIKGVIK